MKYNYKKIAKKVGIAGFVLAVMSVGMLFFAGAAQAAGNSGVYTSPVHDYGVSINFGNITWAASTTASTTITMKVRPATRQLGRHLDFMGHGQHCYQWRVSFSLRFIHFQRQPLFPISSRAFFGGRP